MKAFTFQRVAATSDAAGAVAARPGAMFLAGGTTLVDLMNVDVLTPDTVVDVRHLHRSWCGPRAFRRITSPDILSSFVFTKAANEFRLRSLTRMSSPVRSR